MANTKWFSDAKYGMFIHFGLYSILAGEYKGQRTRGLAEWIMNHLDIPVEEYRKLASQFDPKDFDAKKIVEYAKRWGMKYICLTSKHHDGFALFHSKVSKYNSVDASPCQRDLVKELADACHEAEIPFCLYYSQAQDWDDPDGYWAGKSQDGKNFTRYFHEKCLPQVDEILSNYGKISMLWFDTPMGMSKEECQELRQFVKERQPDCLISGRIGHHQWDFATTQDNRMPAYPVNALWEMPGTTNDSWGYKYYDHNWRQPKDILQSLLQVCARGGNYLLNVGPDANGNIPEQAIKNLDEVGVWLKDHADSIYGTSVIPPYVYETDGIVFTHRPNHLYIHFLHPEKEAGHEIPFPNMANHAVKGKWIAQDKEFGFRETNTLEGDKYWGVRLPEEVNTLCLTCDIETEEAECLIDPLNF